MVKEADGMIVTHVDVTVLVLSFVLGSYCCCNRLPLPSWLESGAVFLWRPREESISWIFPAGGRYLHPLVCSPTSLWQLLPSSPLTLTHALCLSPSWRDS